METLRELLQVNNVTKIDSYEKINELINIESLIDGIYENNKKPEDKNVLILFDTDVFNSTYLIDVYNAFVETIEFTGVLSEMMKNTTVYYCDDFDTYTKLFQTYFNRDLDRNNLTPVFLFETHKDIYIEKEPTFGVFNEMILCNFFKQVQTDETCQQPIVNI